jgi:hypothetical protein
MQLIQTLESLFYQRNSQPVSVMEPGVSTGIEKFVADDFLPRGFVQRLL